MNQFKKRFLNNSNSNLFFSNFKKSSFQSSKKFSLNSSANIGPVFSQAKSPFISNILDFTKVITESRSLNQNVNIPKLADSVSFTFNNIKSTPLQNSSQFDSESVRAVVSNSSVDSTFDSRSKSESNKQTFLSDPTFSNSSNLNKTVFSTIFSLGELIYTVKLEPG